MAVQNPPWPIQAGSHGAELVRRHIHAVVDGRGGIVSPGDLAVAENGTPNMTVNVAAGRVLVPGTEATFQAIYFCESRATENRAIAAADATNPRKDLVVARVKDAAYSGVTNSWDIEVVTGTPAPSPSEPAVPANSWVLALVDVPALDTAITNSQITDRRTQQAGQLGRAAGLGGVIACTQTTRPAHQTGRVIYETDTKRVYVSDGSAWTLVNYGVDYTSADVLTDATTASTSYTDTLSAGATGPSVSVYLEAGQKSRWTIFAALQVQGAGATAAIASLQIDGPGASDLAASDTNSIESGLVSEWVPGFKETLFTATVAGVHTGKMVYKVVGATNAEFKNRRITGEPR